MPIETFADAAPACSQISIFERFLQSENDVIRCAAVRALPKLDVPKDDLRAILTEFFVDEDPDVRSDAMEAFVALATPKDAATIRRSLQGDPVREVKLAAIRALARIGDPDAIPILRALVKSRSDEQVAWEDEGADWEDWLDIQNAAITALGTMQAEIAIDDLIDALFDGFGQNVDVPVFAALGRMGDHGRGVLLETFRQTEGPMRRHAAAALAQISPDTLAPYIDTLLDAEERDLRLLALEALAVDDPRCETLARQDADPSIRAAAIERASTAFPELVVDGLSDPDDLVKAAALRSLQPPFAPEFHDALIDNLLLWLPDAKSELGKAIVETLCLLAPNRALGPLLSILDDPERDLELRVSAARGIGQAELATPTAVVAGYLSNPSRQVRAALLSVLLARSKTDEDALHVVRSAIEGTLDVSNADIETEEENGQNSDASIPKEGAGQGRIRITPEGDIVPRDEIEVTNDSSTLDQILVGSTNEPTQMAEDTPEETGAKRAKRRPVEGSGDLAHLLTLDALSILGKQEVPALIDGILKRTGDTDDAIRRAAWQALSQCTIAPKHLPVIEAGLGQSDPVIRMAAFCILCDHDHADAIAEGLKDEDALIRAEAVRRLPAKSIVEFVADRAPLVRKTAAARILSDGSDTLISDAMSCAVQAEQSDIVAVLSAGSRTAKSTALSLLAQIDDNRQALVIMQGLG